MKLKLSEKKRLIAIASAGIVGTALIIFSAFPSKTDTASKSRLDEYIFSTEERLCRTVEKIDGAGKATVFITVSDTYETVYASNSVVNRSGNTAEKQIAFTQGSSYSSEPVVVKELCPDIKGVLIVCKGGNDPNVKNEITKSASIALGISSSKIHVTGGND